MPSAAARPCRHVGCPQLVRDGSGYCVAHQKDKAANRFGDENRASASARGYGVEWRKTRARIMKRDAGLCQSCLKDGHVTPATQVDHIVSKRQGGTDDEANLQALCDGCHRFKTAREALRGRGG